MNSLTFCNAGIEKDIDGLTVEILSHNFHNPHCNIVCTYFMEDNKKVEVTYYKDITQNRQGHEVYYFHGKNSLSHYYSRVYNQLNIPRKYKQIAEQLKNIYDKINFEEYKTKLSN